VSAPSIDKCDLTQKVIAITTRRDTAMEEEHAALKARTDAYRERAEMAGYLQHTSGDNSIITEDIRKLMIEKIALLRELEMVKNKADEAAHSLTERRISFIL